MSEKFQAYRKRRGADLGGMVLLGLGVIGMSQGAIAQSSLPTPSSAYALLIAQSADAPTDSLCPAPVLSRLTRYQTRAGDTIASLAQRHNLTAETLIGMNPVLRQGNPPVGTSLLIPPINGLRVEVPTGRTWRDLAQQYRVRADVLFEANGCRPPGRVAFVPGATLSSANPAAGGTAAGTAADPNNRPRITSPDRAAAILRTHPLGSPTVALVIKGYGWQIDPRSGQVVFNSGVDLAASEGNPVVSAGEGTVAFAANQGNYGNLVVVNHPEGLQTRYAQLGTIQVQVGQRVQAGDRLGTVGRSAPDQEPLLRFEVRSNSDLGWVAQDPGLYFQDMRVGQ
ncbi:LysM peptidoglycan-binding domain-containing M23 family metallopeptidase [Leptolyngbya sp. O-77]|uniref:LysM peptidoglycan-binding domain-containing M23 family metallopeptidase n=1 Tax=Leptolyngbya sp. O-77 TaxID=1080068 RepID=UPI00074D3283|nr:M23 family metallopeptidase [Leptolyngbya sp. O-77]BAU43889.1 Murein hydrolase activator NlpD precursor [Leptolyngbya sp. O-77]